MDLITPDFGLIFWQTVTLGVVLWVLGKFAWKPILSTIQAREDSIASALQAAQAAQAMVAQVRAEKETLLQTAHAEREKIITEALATKNALVEEATLEAAQASKKVLEETRAHLEEEKKAAKAVVQNEIAALSVNIAEQLLHSELQHKNAQEELAQRLVEKAQWN